MTKLEQLRKDFANLSPKDRNDRLQAIYAAFLEERSDTGEITSDDVAVFDVLQKSFDKSIKWQQLEGDVELFDTISVDIKAVRKKD